MLTQSVTANLQAPAASPPGASLPIMLAGLVADASNAIGDDQVTARTLLAQALRLLQSTDAGGHLFAPRPVPQASLAPWRAKRIAEHIEANLANALSLSELAAIARLSESHFSRAFKGAFGQTPQAFITSRRIERARCEMLEGREPLSQIALTCGFAEQAHLGRVFRRIAGQAPNAWRQEHRPLGLSSSAGTKQQKSSRPPPSAAPRLALCSGDPPCRLED